MNMFFKSAVNLTAVLMLLSSCTQSGNEKSEREIGHELKNVDKDFSDIILYLQNSSDNLLKSIDSSEVEYRAIVGKHNDCVFVEFSGNVFRRGPDMIACKSRKDGKILEL